MKKWKKCFIMFIVLVVVFGYYGATLIHCMPNHQLPMTQVEMIAKSMESVVAIHISSYDGHIGSGFYVGNGIIITAGHMLKKNKIEKVVFKDEIECSVFEQIVHPDYDVGILIIDDLNKPVLKFNPTEVKQGEVIFILGNPGELTFASTKGIIAGRINIKLFGETFLIVTDAATWAGNSGSVVLDIDGKIRGVHVGWVSNMGDYSLDICAADILNALEQAGLEID